MLVAFSGGPDSTALLLLLAELRAERRLTLHAAHFDHRLRDGSSDVARRCAATAARLGVPCRLGAPARPLRRSQAAFRDARLAFLRREARVAGADRIALGHQADDQAETVLFRVLRGTGLRGLAGIPWRRGPFVRPLLGIRRSELAGFVASRGVMAEADPANEDLRWTRTRMRRVLGRLSADGTDVVGDLCRLADEARRVDRFLDARAAVLLRRAARESASAGSVRLDRDILGEAPRELRARALRRLARASGIDLTRGGTRAGEEFIRRGPSGGTVDVGGGLWLERSFDEIVLRGPTGPAGDPVRRMPGAGAGDALRMAGVRGRGAARAGDRVARIRWSGEAPAGTGGAVARVALRVPRGHFPLSLGPWLPGQRIRTTAGTRKLKKTFGESRVPREDRRRRFVLADRAGRVLWVEGVATAADAVPAPDANLWIEVEDV
ncbi:MAG: tRNA lysidine(34) synthetase TilS [Gemmatimonadota bacterium]|nr:tRNA lysidine(34) synthetase TilS [Gemmatimonadota bacterium]